MVVLAVLLPRTLLAAPAIAAFVCPGPVDVVAVILRALAAAHVGTHVVAPLSGPIGS